MTGEQKHPHPIISISRVVLIGMAGDTMQVLRFGIGAPSLDSKGIFDASPCRVALSFAGGAFMFLEYEPGI